MLTMTNVIVSLLILATTCLFLPSVLLEAQNRALYIVDPENPIFGRTAKRPIAGSRKVEDCVQAGSCDRFNITTSDGIFLDNYLSICSKPRAIIIYFHGNAGSIYDHFPFASQLSRKTNSLVVMADYRGYGLSDGTPSENGLRLDALAILKKTTEYATKFSSSNFLHEKIIIGEDRPNVVMEKENALPIIVHGHSLGAAVAIDLASVLPSLGDKESMHLDAVVISNAFTSIREMILHLLQKYLPSNYFFSRGIMNQLLFSLFKRVILPLFQRVYWNNSEKVAQIECPTWFIGAHNDDLVPVSHTHQLHGLAVGTKSKTIYYDVRHDNLQDSAAYYWDYNAFIDSVLKEKSTTE